MRKSHLDPTAESGASTRASRRRYWVLLAATLALLATGGSTAAADDPSDPDTDESSQDAADESSEDDAASDDSDTFWSCDEGDEPRILTPDVTAPSLPFRGIVYATMDWDPESETRSLVVRFHDTVSRTNTEIIVEGLRWNHPLSIDRTAAGLVVGSYALSVADSCTLSQRDAGFVVDQQQAWRDLQVAVVMPWGRPARLEAESTSVSDPDQEAGIGLTAHSVSDGLASARFGLGTHANGLHIVAGDQVGAYVLTWYGDEEPPSQLELYGDYRSWNLNDSAFLLGTDGELLAFALWPLEPAWAGHEITVISMRTGEVVACGYGEFGTFQLFTPAGEGLVVPEIKLPPSGHLAVRAWPDADRQCPRDIDGSFFDYLASQPVPPPALAAPAARPVDLPSTAAPTSPFNGIVRTFTRYNPASYGHDRIVQYYDSGSGGVTEIVFDGDIGPRLGDPRLVDEGILFGRGSGTSVLIRWGSAPELVAAERLARPALAPRERSLALAADAPASPESVMPCTSQPLDVGGLIAQAKLTNADYGHRWNRPRLLEVTLGDVHGTYLLDSPAEELAGVIEVSTECHGPTFAAGFDEYSPRLIGSDGTVLVLSYEYAGGEDFFGEPGTYLTYVISLQTGEVLECGIEPRSSGVLFLSSDTEASVAHPPRLPPSGWLDPHACTDGETTVEPQDCTSIFWRRDDDFVCARELDFRAISESRPGISPTPATIRVLDAEASS